LIGAVQRPPLTALAKASLLDTASGQNYTVMYNPDELRLEQGNNYAEIGIPGLDTSPVQYIRGKARVLTMELFFDTCDTGIDVRKHTDPIVGLLDTQPTTHAPPVLIFSMGGLQFTCVLVDAGQRFTMFLRSGTPVRSVLSVRLQEYVRVDVRLQRGLFVGSPTATTVANAVAAKVAPSLLGSTVHVTQRGDTLAGLAGALLGDAANWRDIAQANNIDDPLHLPPGTRLIIPAQTTSGAR